MPHPLNHGSFRRFLSTGLGATLLWLALATAGTAQGVPPLAEIEQRYDTLELSRGWVLRPLDEAEFQTLEIHDGAIVVDGITVDEDGLRRYVDEDADWILRLAAGEFPALPEPPDAPEPPGVDADGAAPPAPSVEEDGAGRDREERRRSRRSERKHRDSQVSMGSSMVVEEDETVQDVVLFSGSLEVLGEVEGDATVVIGSARVSGRIDGDLVVVGGSVTLEPSAVIDGEVVAVGGAVRRKSGATVDGEITQVGIGENIHLGDLNIDIGAPEIFWPDFNFSFFDLVGRSIGLGFLTVILLLVLFLVPRKIQKIRRRAELEPWKSGLVGLMVEILFIPLVGLVAVVLLISIVGIPLLIFVLPLMFVAIMIYFLLGFAAICLLLGDLLARRFGRPNLSPYLALFAGLLLIYVWSIIGSALSSVMFPISFVGFLLGMFGFCLKYVGWTLGLGAAVLDLMAPLPSDDPYGPDRWAPASSAPGPAPVAFSTDAPAVAVPPTPTAAADPTATTEPAEEPKQP